MHWVKTFTFGRAILAFALAFVPQLGCQRMLPVVDEEPMATAGAAAGSISGNGAAHGSAGGAGVSSARAMGAATSAGSSAPAGPVMPSTNTRPFSDAVLKAARPFDCKGAPTATQLSMEEHVEGVALSADSVFFSTLRKIWKMPKDQSAPASAVTDLGVSTPLALLGDQLYFIDLSTVKRTTLDGKTIRELDTEVGGIAFTITSDSTAVYGSETNSTCDPNKVFVATADGESVDVDVTCAQEIAAIGGTIALR